MKNPRLGRGVSFSAFRCSLDFRSVTGYERPRTRDKDNTMKEDTVRSLERGLEVLSCFDPDTEELSLTGITERLDLPPSTVRRLVTALTGLGYLEKGSTKGYRLSSRTYLLGAIAQQQYRLVRIARPPMLALRDVTGEAVTLYALESNCRVCYAHEESLLSMRCVVRVGDRFPLWAGAAGKCLLAYASPNLVEQELAKLQALTPRTINDRERFLSELARVRDAEEAVSSGERVPGVISVAVPLFSRRNDVLYTLSLALPEARATDAHIKDCLSKTKEAARVIAGQLYS